MTGIETLEISRLDESGQVIRRIRCLAGRVTVFRANTPELLESYHRAFEGVRQKERFSMILDTATFNPHEHHLIGFGERFGDSRKEPVSEYLQKNGVAPEAVESMLLTHGLGGLGTAPCCDLSPAQERIVRILAATASINKVLILNDPFEIVPDQWREKLAGMIVDYAWKKKAIVVVTKLTYRPEVWIENEIIGRIQLERPRQRTIGFGGEGFNATELIQSVRAHFSTEEKKEEKKEAPAVEAVPPPSARIDTRKIDLFGAPPPSSTSQKMVSQALVFGKLEPVHQARPFGWGFALALCFLTVVVTGIIAYAQLSLTSQPESYSKAISKPVVHDDVVVKIPDTQVKPPPSSGSVLESYPSNIKDAVFQAFTDPSAQTQLAVSLTTKKAVPKVIEQTNFTYAASNQNYNQDEAPSPGAVSDAEMEHRREEIRQRFLEAIQAQADNNR